MRDSSDPLQLGLKACGHCSGATAEIDYVGPPCPHCDCTGLTDDLRPWGYCEGNYMASACMGCGERMYEIAKRSVRCKPCALQLKEESMAKIPEPSDAHVEAASSTPFMLRLLSVGDAFGRAGTKGPFTAGLPGLFPGFVGKKNGYRQIPVAAGSSWEVNAVTIAKTKGIMFGFKPVDEAPANSEKDHPEWIELTYDDLVNTFGDLAEAVDQALVLANQIEVAPMNAQLKEAIKKNPAMHKVLSAGFERAVSKSVEKAEAERVETVPGWGSW